MFPKDPKVEDLILEALTEGQQNTVALIEKIKVKRPQTTKQAVYKALRVLKENETIVQTREEVSLSSVWLKRLADFTERAELNYKSIDRPSIDFLGLKQGEKMSYSFSTFESTDMFWAHAFDVLADVLPVSSPIFLYNPHEWFLLARPESEVYLFNRTAEHGKKLFLIAGNNDPLDKYVTKYFDGEAKQYYASPEALFPKKNYYCNVFDDFLIEVWLDPNVSEKIDSLYKCTKEFDENIKAKLLDTIRQKGKNKLVITRNKRKADGVKRMFKEYFLI